MQAGYSLSFINSIIKEFQKGKDYQLPNLPHPLKYFTETSLKSNQNII